MRLIILSLCAGIALLASVAAGASRPVATLRSGAVVDLNTGIVTTPDGKHYQLSATRLKRIRQRLARGNAGAANGKERLTPAAAAATGAKAERKSGKKRPPR